MELHEMVELYELAKIKEALKFCNDVSAKVMFVRDTVEITIYHGAQCFDAWGGDIVDAVNKLKNKIDSYYKKGGY